MYLKTAYRNDPIFTKAQVILTLYNNVFTYKFDEHFIDKVRTVGLSEEKLVPLASADFRGLLQTGIKYADVITRSEALQHTNFKELVDEHSCTTIENNEEGLENYYNLYQKLASI